MLRTEWPLLLVGCFNRREECEPLRSVECTVLPEVCLSLKPARNDGCACNRLHALFSGNSVLFRSRANPGHFCLSHEIAISTSLTKPFFFFFAPEALLTSTDRAVRVTPPPHADDVLACGPSFRPRADRLPEIV